MLLWVLKATIGLFGKSIESKGGFSMRCQCLTNSFLRRYVGKCGVYVVVKVRRSSALRGLFASVLSVIEFNPSNASMLSCLYPFPLQKRLC